MNLIIYTNIEAKLLSSSECPSPTKKFLIDFNNYEEGTKYEILRQIDNILLISLFLYLGPSRYNFINPIEVIKSVVSQMQ